MNRLQLCAGFLALAVIPATVLSAPWEGPRLTEAELRAKEADFDQAKAKTTTTSLTEITRSGIYLSYAVAHQRKTQSFVLGPSTVAEQGDIYNPFVFASAVDTSVSSFSSGSVVLLGAGVALELFNWATRDRTNEKLQALHQRDLDNFKYPSLWLVRLQKDAAAEPSNETADLGHQEQKLEEMFSKAQSDLLAWPLNCDQAFYRATNPLGWRKVWGEYVPGISHSRMFICGHDGLDLSLVQIVNEKVELITERTSEDVLVTRYALPRLDRRHGILKSMGLPKGDENLAAVELYKKLGPTLDKEFVAVYTGPNQDGKWSVFVASNGSEPVEYPLP